MGAPVPPDPDRVDRVESTVVHEHSPVVREQRVVETPGTVVETTPVVAPASAHAQHVVADYAAEQRAQLSRVTNLIGYVFGLLIALILIRVLLSAIGANPNNGFAQFIYSVTGVFVAPFAGLTATPVYGGAAFEIYSLVAAIAYALLGWAIIKLVWLLFYRPSTSEVNTTTYHRG